MSKPARIPGVRRFPNDIDREHELDADAEYALAEADYQKWLARRWSAEGYDERDDAYDTRDPDDRLEIEGGRL